MIKKISYAALSVFLAILMVVLFPLQVLAAEEAQYISEIRIGYGEEGLQKLKDANYTVWEEKTGTYLNANEGGTGRAVYIGYKTTSKKEEAITDIAIMPMATDGKSAYSFDVYDEEMEALNKQIDAKLERFDASIEEFRANYKKSAPYNDYAVRAYTMLNMYIEDDTGLGLGDLFVRDVLDETDTKENGMSTGKKLKQVYHNIFMMGNSVAVSAIQTALAMGCTETDGETFLDRLADSEFTGEIDETKNESLTTVARSINAFRDELRDATATRAYADAYEGGRDAYINALVEKGEDYASVIGSISLLEIMESIQYGDVTDLSENPLSFYDVMMLPTTLEGTSRLMLTTEMLYLLADAMTPGQVSISESVGLSALIKSAYSTKSAKITGTDGMEHFDLSTVDGYLKELEQVEKISVYIGVDRTVFNDYETIAITDAAIREHAKNQELGSVAGYKASTGYIAMGVIGSIVAVASIGVAIAGFRASTLVPLTDAELASELFDAADTYNGYKMVWSQSGKSMAIGGCICAAIGIVVAIIGFIKAINAPEMKTVEYSAIPRAIIDVKSKSDGEDLYFVYYAARLAGASDDYVNEKDTTKLYGDLNGLNEIEPWLALYYAKDLRLGSPLTTKILVKNTASLSTLQKEKYTPAHDFFNNSLTANNQNYTPFDLNKTSQKAGHPSIYVFFKRDTKVQPLTSTIVDQTASFNWFALVTFCVGAGLAAGVTVFAMNRKCKKKVES